LAQRIQMTDFIVAAKHMCTYHAHVKNKRLPGKKKHGGSKRATTIRMLK